MCRKHETHHSECLQMHVAGNIALDPALFHRLQGNTIAYVTQDLFSFIIVIELVSVYVMQVPASVFFEVGNVHSYISLASISVIELIDLGPVRLNQITFYEIRSYCVIR